MRRSPATDERTAKLYGMLHSHPVVAARLMLEQSGVEHEVWNILPGLHAPLVRALGFPRWTVPALRIDGQRIQGTLEISRVLDRLAPDAGLFPRAADARRAVEEAERWGHDQLQPVARRVFRWAGAHSNSVRAWMAREVVGLPAPAAFGLAFTPVMLFFARRVSGANDATVRADLLRLPQLLARADELLETGVLGGDPPNAADHQIFSSLRLLLAHEDLRPVIERWNCSRATIRLLPDFPRPGPEALPAVPAALPREWLADASPSRGRARRNRSAQAARTGPS